MEKDAYDDFSDNELESDLFRKGTTHEEHSEHLFSEMCPLIFSQRFPNTNQHYAKC